MCELGISDDEGVVPIGLWTDSTPYAWDRKQSVEPITLCFPGATTPELQNIRVVLAAYPKRWAAEDTKRE
eukprot:5845961-Amphidinium_carterae.1